ncbi:TetR/AcrR family transcriptional regulator [Rathayibacter sp. VKM Ac-2857]|uniref:TetR/AcrR family transcriptional regulator n=1 Tax=Rathayibacter sp. VKM Ac-2857 TaxID=2739020 RepID=UPI0015673D86|nr:TetR/AcrR family transcriptional regulator [Rathayibacter sp. VKM Ac-2857]NQX18310.1 TetR/AcrR family transcriptional regulator [Rathayibacter sp. VKM Ac-2857]
MARPLRADAERSVQAILEAAERVLAADHSAPIEQIAAGAGLTRTTVHRRFANRQAIVDALAIRAKQELVSAIRDAHMDEAPALVALHRISESVLRVKDRWRFTLGDPLAVSTAATEIWADINERTLELLTRARDEGLIEPSVDLAWTRQVYYALLAQAIEKTDRSLGEQDHVALASLVVETLLRGANPYR